MQDERTDRGARPWWALMVALLAATAAVWLVVTTSPGPVDETPAMLDVSPGGTIELEELPADQQVTYRAAAADAETFSQVRCYCGCEAFLDHRHLLDCFVRPDGGWERHATGCAVCLAEADQVLQLREADTPVDAIVDRIDTTFGGITAPSA